MYRPLLWTSLDQGSSRKTGLWLRLLHDAAPPGGRLRPAHVSPRRSASKRNGYFRVSRCSWERPAEASKHACMHRCSSRLTPLGSGGARKTAVTSHGPPPSTPTRAPYCAYKRGDVRGKESSFSSSSPLPLIRLSAGRHIGHRQTATDLPAAAEGPWESQQARSGSCRAQGSPSGIRELRYFPPSTHVLFAALHWASCTGFS